MNISKANTLIVKDKDDNVISIIEIGSVQLAKMRDKTQVLTIREAKDQILINQQIKKL